MALRYLWFSGMHQVPFPYQTSNAIIYSESCKEALKTFFFFLLKFSQGRQEYFPPNQFGNYVRITSYLADSGCKEHFHRKSLESDNCDKQIQVNCTMKKQRSRGAHILFPRTLELSHTLSHQQMSLHRIIVRLKGVGKSTQIDVFIVPVK